MRVSTFDEYSDLARGSDRYPRTHTRHGELPVYPALALGGEAGEFAEKVKKAWRDDHPLDPMAGLNELGDILWYIRAAAEAMGYTLKDVAEANLVKVLGRRERGTLHGSGDNR